MFVLLVERIDTLDKCRRYDLIKALLRSELANIYSVSTHLYHFFISHIRCIGKKPLLAQTYLTLHFDKVIQLHKSVGTLNVGIFTAELFYSYSE